MHLQLSLRSLHIELPHLCNLQDTESHLHLCWLTFLISKLPKSVPTQVSPIGTLQHVLGNPLIMVTHQSSLQTPTSCRHPFTLTDPLCWIDQVLFHWHLRISALYWAQIVTRVWSLRQWVLLFVCRVLLFNTSVNERKLMMKLSFNLYLAVLISRWCLYSLHPR